MTDPHDAPDVDQLLEAVVEFLRDTLLPVTPDEERFHLRVAVNVLGIVRRELALGPDQERAHRARLAAIGFADDRELAAAIRAGTVDPQRVRAMIAETVVDKLLVANPRYLDEEGDPA